MPKAMADDMICVVALDCCVVCSELWLNDKCDDVHELRFNECEVLMGEGEMVRQREEGEVVKPGKVQQEGLLMQTRSLTGQCEGDLCGLEEGCGVKVEVRVIMDAACGLNETW